MIRVTVWHEYLPHEETSDVLAAYPEGLGTALADIYRGEEFSVHNAYFSESEQGLPERLLDQTDVLLWWGHGRHHLVEEITVDRVADRVRQGMGAIFLHSAHASKPFIRLMGTTCTLKWREAGEREHLWITSPTHPIAQGLGDCFSIPHEEMYGEYFDIPTPDDVVFVGWFQGGNVFRSGVTYTRGLGKVFYFQPGHETFPVYTQPEIKQVLQNAARWANPVFRKELSCPNEQNPREKINF